VTAATGVALSRERLETMLSRLEDAQRALLASAAELADARHGSAGLTPEQTHQLLDLYYRHAAPDDIVDRTPLDILGAAVSHYRLALHRPQGTAAVRVFTPTVQHSEWTARGHSVVEIVTDDMPFLVDSVTMALTTRNRSIHVVIHPQLMVRRDVAGRLEDICPDESAAADSGDRLVSESWMHLEIDRESDPAALQELEQALAGTLRDVREAVEDWTKMRDQAYQIVAELKDEPPPLAAEEVAEGRELLSWLADEHFTFLGYREYQLAYADDEAVLRAMPGTGLGILRSDQDMSASFGKLPPAVAAKAREKTLLIITKANSRSTVHRPAYLDYVSVKKFDDAGEVVGERRFLGLFSSAAYTESLTRIPVLRVKARQVLEGAGFSARSHSGKTLMDILETYPRDELFQTPVDELLPVALAVLHLRERRQLRFFARRDAYGRYLSCLVYLPRDRYTTQVREQIQDILTSTLGAESIDYTARVSESVLARLHFVVRAATGQTLKDFDESALEEKLASATRSWTDDLVEALTEQYGEERGAKWARAYAHAFPEAYKEDFRPSMGAIDVEQLEAVGPDDIRLSLYSPVDAGRTEARFKVFRTGSPLSLSAVLPILSAMGVEVVDERPYELERPNGLAWVYDFGLRCGSGIPHGVRDRFQENFMAVWRGLAESDGFSALVLSGGLHWRQVAVLRAYAKYFRQGGSPFSQEYIESSLVANVPIARMLVSLFEVSFDPDAESSGLAEDGDTAPLRRKKAAEIAERIVAALDGVASLDQDRILRSYLAAINATLRTNFYQVGPSGEPPASLSLKLEPKQVPDLPQPRPEYEIFVYSPRLEGVHLRFGPVARGGLRWSDRREDFRTEVLGLVKAQMVKNAVIVPVGAKGGFYCKRLPNPATDREAWLAEGIECYKTFIRGLLDVTDNLVDGQTVPPPRVVRHDGDDSYLVVAADKGTASFSDIANDVAHEYGFWLGDAFASGGSVGYDHKAMGITARGAWESVRRHFRERGIDTQSEDFTCVGIGDMSGDVFGNGMLRSEHLRLVAAFDHRDIFVDPDPDAKASFVERQRLFDRPRSSWADYDPDLISTGGGVFSRSLKSIPVSAEMREVLGLDAGTTALSPAELMRAILLAPVDLLWNGGIGTYVKSSAESNVDVGDRANDAIRVDGANLRCKAVGEGGNLGCTQRGRIEYALAGGRICTDFIDNSAGVDTSDHEVNIKILLDRVVRAGDLTVKQRNELLASMTDEVAALVLADNDGQNQALASASSVAPGLMHVHAAWVRRLEKLGLLNRELEFLPSVKEFETRRAAGVPLTEPELAILLAYTKIVLAAELLSSDLPDDRFLRSELFGYFPGPMRQQYRRQMEEHPLRREIIVTQVVNDLVNFAGITFFHRLSQETGATAVDLARAHLVCREIYAADSLVQQIQMLDNSVAASVQTDMRLAVRTLVERATRWMVNNRRSQLDSETTVDHLGTDLQQLVKALPDILTGVEAADFAVRRDALAAADVPADLATAVAALPPAYAALEVVEIAHREGVDPLEVARMHTTLAERLGLSALLGRIAALPRDDRWQTMARAALRDDLYAVHARLTARVLDATDPEQTAEDRIASWERQDAAAVRRAASTLAEITSDDAIDLARMSVGLGVVRRLLSSG
jgi:glutamate dehydrogenase